MSQLEVVHVEADFALGRIDDVTLQSWMGKVTADHVRRGFQLSTRMVQGGSKQVSLAASDPTAGLPDDETRKLSAELIAKVAPFTVASAIVIEGSGFWATAARAAVIGIHLLARTSYPQKPFASMADATRWLAELLKWSEDKAKSVREAMEALRVQQRALRGK